MRPLTLTVVALTFTLFLVAPAITFAAGLCDAATIADCDSVGKSCDPNTGACVTITSGGGSNQTITSGGGNIGGPNVTLINPLGSGASLSSFLTSILQFVIRIGSIVVILMLVYVGYMFVIARGEPDKITEARQALLWTIVGALILLGAQAIAIGIQATVQALSVGS